MLKMQFLSAAKPLVKSFSLDADGNIKKESYPIVKNFTSHEEPITNLKDVYNAVTKHAALGNCVLKGNIKKPLSNESRASATKSTDTTLWALIDLDGSPYKTPEEFMNAHAELKDVSYVLQYSASQGIYPHEKLSCHIFMLLDAPLQAQALKNWLTKLNMDNPLNKSALELTKTGATLHYPIDITTCQNDKIIYIAPPQLGKGVKSKLPAGDRIQYIKKKHDTLNSNAVLKQAPEKTNKEVREVLDALREKHGLNKLTTRTKYVGEYNVQLNPGEQQITGIKYAEDYVHFNFNGGDSWSYWHPANNFELIHCFKHPDISFQTKEIAPQYYKDCLQEQAEDLATPTEAGDLLLAFCDPKSDNYYRGVWNEKNHKLELYKTRDTTRLNHFLIGHGKLAGIGDCVPTWNMEFNPQAKYIVDVPNKRVNTYLETEYLRAKHPVIKDVMKSCPVIMKVVKSAVSGNKENDLLEFFLNWSAVMFQKRNKTRTAFILTGTYGTGKNVLFDHIFRPLLGEKYTAIKRAAELEENYTGYLEQILLVFVDEIHIPASAKKDKVMADLFNQIPNRTATYRNMHSMAYEGINYTNFLMSSNHPDPIKIEPNDRRFNFSEYQIEKLELTDDELYVQIPKELQAFCDYLMTREANTLTAASIFQHRTRDNIIAASRTSLDEIGDVLKQGNLESLWDSMPDLNLIAELHGADSAVASAFANIVTREIYTTFRERSKFREVNGRKIPVKAGTVVCHSKLTRDELNVIFEHCVGDMPSSPNKFTSLLRHRGIVIEAIRVNGNILRGIDVEWLIDERRLKEIHDQLETKKPTLKVVSKAKVL